MKLRKNTQLTFINRKGAGRPVLHHPGIRHNKRIALKRPSPLHLTVKVIKNKADIKNKIVLKILKRAIFNARKQGLKVIHYSLEYDHIHLLIEADNNKILGLGMQSFGVTMAKAINHLKKVKGSVYLHRYHLRKITGPKQLKNVMSYIFHNGMKHKSAKSLVNPYNSIKAEIKYHLFFQGYLVHDFELIRVLDPCRIFYHALL